MGSGILPIILLLVTVYEIRGSEFFPSSRLGGGKILGRTMPLNECLRYCNTYSIFCHGIDYNSKRQVCVLHTKTTECKVQIPAAHSDWFHYRRTDCGYDYEATVDKYRSRIHGINTPARALGGTLDRFARMGSSYARGNACPTGQYFYRGFPGVLTASPQESNIRTDIQTFQECLQECQTFGGCRSFGFNHNTSMCVHFGLQGVPAIGSSPTPDCCLHFNKHCRITGSVQSTESPIPYDITRIPDSGYCPDRFGKLERTKQVNGKLLQDVKTAENCKAECLYNVALGCMAVDFNKETEECFYHDTILPSQISENEDCCDHYRRTTCIPKTCYQQSTMNFDRTTQPASFKPFNVLLSNLVTGLTTTSCPSTMCFLTYTLDMSGGSIRESVVRGCEPCSDSPPTFGCRKSVSSGGTEITYHCVCEGHRCNSFDQNTFRERFGHYSLDGHARDSSGLYRNADAVNVVYDSLDAKKNRSAIFNGTAYLNIQSFSGIQFSKVQDNGDTVPGVTIALWLKRPEAEGGSMTIFSNGPRTYAPLEMRSNEIPGDNTMHQIQAYIRAGDKEFMVEAPAPIDTWVFAVLQLRPLFGTSQLEARLYLTTGPTMGAAPDDTDVQPLDNIDRLRMTLSPMCFGKQLIKTSPTRASPGYFFKGRMDEIHIFTDGAITSDALQSIIDTTKPFP